MSDPADSSTRPTVVGAARLDWRGAEALVLHANGVASWSTGYAFAGSRLLEGAAIGAYLAEQPQLGAAAAGLNGCFAAALDTPEGARLVTDRYGSVPIYGTVLRDGRVVASPEPWSIVGALERAPQLDPVGALDMLRLGYVAGTRTLIDGVSSMPPASVSRADASGAFRRERYWRFGYWEDPALRDLEQAARALIERVDTLGNRIDALTSQHDRGVSLMLTGGLDTRFLAGVLATRTDAKVHAYTYGVPDDPDVLAADAVAARVGFDFSKVPIDAGYLDDDYIDRSIREVGITTRFTCGTGARIAPLPSTSVVMVGHTGFLSSDLAMLNWHVRTVKHVRAMVYLRHFSYPGSDPIVRRVSGGYAADRWDQSLDETLADFDGSVDPVGEMHRWNIENRQRKLVLMEMQVYARRAPWMLPLNDYDVVDLFCGIPYEQRLDQVLYKYTTSEYLGRGAAEGLVDVPRVGKTMTIDKRKSLRFRLVRALGPVSGEIGGQVGFLARRVKSRTLDPVLTFGPNPLRHWFYTDARVRALLLERVGGITCEAIDADALRTELLRPEAREPLFQSTLTAAITMQGAIDEARRVWEAAAR